MRTATALLATVLLTTAAAAQEKSALIGKVFDAKSGEALVTAQILVDQVKANVGLSNQARFVLGGLEPGRHRIDIRNVGYRPLTAFIEFAPGQTVERTFELEFTGEQLPNLEVEAKASKALSRFSDFERRRARGVGHFITRDEITSRSYMNMGDALRTVKGVRVYCDAIDCLARMVSAPAGCGPTFFVDGQVARSFATTTPINDVQAIEIYRGAGEIPAEFTGSNSGCGVVVIWTKSTP